MTGYKRVNYYELCRLCTSSQPKDKVHIFREEGRKMQLQQKIQTCFHLLVCEHDYLPKVVCSTCVETLEQCYTFRQNCISSETMLSSYFANFRFTDDFKKAGKVYVKDTGQKLETTNQNNNIVKKCIQETIPINVPTTNIISDTTQQYFTLELPTLPEKPVQTYGKLTLPTINNAKSSNDFETQALNSHPNILTTPKLPKPSESQQTNLVSCNIASLNFNGNIVQAKNEYDPKLSVESNVEFNLLKTNAMQPMMVIDVEQLIDSGLPETEVSKLRELLLKPNRTAMAAKQVPNDVNLIQTKPNPSNEPNLKLYKCEICDKLFKRREHLYQHTKLHTGLRPFKCIHCTKTFSRKEHLMRHLTSHSGVKDFTCDICYKKFSRPDNLKKHKKTHQKSGPFVCDICQKSFVIKHYYLVHKLQHNEHDPLLETILKEEGHI